MKTLEQWQKELPDYEVWQGFYPEPSPSWKGVECYIGCTWNPVEAMPHGDFICYNTELTRPGLLAKAGAIFRRKKERQREFKIEVGRPGDNFTYRIDGKPIRNFYSWADGQNITRATLRVDEWGGE